MPRMLIADDNAQIVDILREYAVKEGFEVETAHDGYAALDKARATNFDMILLDIMMPQLSGLEVCRQIRKDSNVPIIMVTAKAEDYDRIMGLDTGADDYIVKPFSPAEVMARIRAVLRRLDRGASGTGGTSTGTSTGTTNSTGATSSASDSAASSSAVVPASTSSSEVLIYKNLRVDLDSYVTTLNGEPVQLTRKEMDLLWLLASNRNKVFSRDNLLDSLWGWDYEGDSRTVDSHIKRLRAKLDVAPHPGWEIKTVWGVGYKFEVHS